MLVPTENAPARVSHLARIVIGGVLLMLAACQPTAAPAVSTNTPVPVAIVKPLATLAPTVTLSDADLIATQNAIPPTPTSARPTNTPTVTPYIGMFIGEAAADPFEPVTELDPLQVILAPTTNPLGIRIICDIAEDAIFGNTWRGVESVRDALACPVQVMFGFTGRTQIFEQGAMYWRPETNEVWAIQPGTAGQVGAYWYVGQAPSGLSTAGLPAPDGRVVPIDAIGSVWFSVPEVRDSLGYGLQGEIDGEVMVQRFDGGALLLDVSAGQVFALLNNGEAYGPYEGNLAALGFETGDAP